MNVAIVNIVVTALIAALGSAFCAAISAQVWMMFAGWIAFLAGGGALKSAPITYGCVILGAILGIGGAAMIGATSDSLGVLGLPVAVFIIVAAALAAQFLPVLSTVIGYFCGMTIYFASGLPPVAASLQPIAIGVAVGVLSGVLAMLFGQWVANRRAPKSA